MLYLTTIVRDMNNIYIIKNKTNNVYTISKAIGILIDTYISYLVYVTLQTQRRLLISLLFYIIIKIYIN